MNIIIAAIALGIIFIGTNFLYLNAILACKVETTGTYIKYNTVQSGHGAAYEPVFRYYVNGEEFQGRCLNKMNLPDIQKQFVVDQTYTIYVNDKKPGYFVVYRKVPTESIIGVLIGIGIIFIGLIGTFGKGFQK